MAAAWGGGFVDVGYSMSAAETAFWQDQAALLDPDAYVLAKGTSQTVTVPDGEHYYVLWAWKVQASGGGTWYFHRNGRVDFFEPMILPEGRSLTTSASVSKSLIYYCRPSLVTGSDSRYTSDPRALYFERMMRLGELAQHTIGLTITNGSSQSATFPTDFADGLLVHTSCHDLAWIGLESADDGAVITGVMEISDTDRIRIAQTTILPFKRATWTKVEARGATQSEGTGTLTYVKLPGDW
jgi:hypothetical protein